MPDIPNTVETKGEKMSDMIDEGDEEALDQLRRGAVSALGRIKKNKTLVDWWTVEAYCATGRRWAMRMSNSNSPNGRRYSDALSVWLNQNPQFRDGITKKERSDLTRCGEQRPAIEAFLSTLEPSRQRALTHPSSIWRAFTVEEGRKERERALERAEAQAAESARGDDGTPLNIPVMPAFGERKSEIVLHKDDGAGLIVATLKRAYAKPMLTAIAKEIVRAAGLTVAEVFGKKS